MTRASPTSRPSFPLLEVASEQTCLLPGSYLRARRPRLIRGVAGRLLRVVVGLLVWLSPGLLIWLSEDAGDCPLQGGIVGPGRRRGCGRRRCRCGDGDDRDWGG